MVIRGVYLIALLTTISGCGKSDRVEPIASVKASRYISSLGFSPSGSILATGGSSHNQGGSSSTVVLWSIPSLRPIGKIPILKQVQAISYSPDGKFIAVSDGGYQGLDHAYLFDPDTGNSLKTFGGSTGWIHDLAFSPDSTLLAFCGSTWVSGADGSGYKDGKVALWDVASGQERFGYESEADTYRSVSFSPSGTACVIGGGTILRGRLDSGEVRVWDVATGQTLWSHQGHSQVVECVAFSPDGEAVASGGMDGVLKLWNADDGEVLFVARRGNKRMGRVLSLAFSPDGKYLAAALGSFNRGSSWGELRVWELRTKPIMEFLVWDESTPMTCVSFSPDGRLLAAGDGEGTLRLWESNHIRNFNY